MSGLFPSIGNSQNIDANGRPLASAVLTVFNGGTTALATVFQDIGLIIPAQNPMTADITGRIPLFYLPDGTYRVRLVDQFGMLIYDYPQVASIGASSTGGGGTPVDPTTVFQTGDELFQKINTLRTGWVRQNGLTIGSATSGASERANADCQNLFLFLWNNFSNIACPVVGGRGANAAADWAANKQITLPDMRGYAAQGLDGMGNARANVIPDAVVTSAISGGPDTGDTPGASGGAATNVIAQANIPAYALPTATIGNAGVVDPGHTHGIPTSNSGVGTNPAPAANNTGVINNTSTQTEAAQTGISVTVQSGGGGAAFDVMNPFKLGTWFIKL